MKFCLAVVVLAVAAVRDPFALQRLLWPDDYFYGKQRDFITSTRVAKETYVPGCNMSGKDYGLAYDVLEFFLTRHPCRVVLTSAKDQHLDVLFGEIKQRIARSKYPLTVEEGGPLRVLDREILKVYDGKECPLSYIKGMVASENTLESLQGHHIAKTGDGVWRTMAAFDEASAAKDAYYRMMKTWADAMVFVGNTWECQNFFRRGIDGGDQWSRDGRTCYRRVVRIRAEDSPNVRYGLAQKARGIEPTDEILVPGVLSYSEYVRRRETWNEIEQCVSLDAMFYTGAEVMMFPALWLSAAGNAPFAREGPFYMGIDTAEGGDSTVWVIVNRRGIVRVVSLKTPDTSTIVARTLSLMHEYNIQPQNVAFDRGGGGKQHADNLRAAGFRVRTVGFGESPNLPLRRGLTPMAERREVREDRYAYTNRRAQMAHELRLLLDPGQPGTFYVPPAEQELLFQLSKIPLTYDEEGRIYLLPKGKKEDSTKKCLIDLIGHSPDEFDALILAVHAMQHPEVSLVKAGLLK